MELTTIIQTKWIGKFSFLILLLSFLPSYVQATVIVDKIFEQEIEVPTGTIIRTKGPGTPNMHLHGTINSTSERGAYTLKGKGGELVFKIDRRFNIFTWDKNTVKHKVSISVEAANAAQEKAILDALKMDLKLNPDNSLEIDCFLGIHKITMKNGWFRGNDNTMIFKNGKEIKFKSITISSELTIPESSNLDLNVRYMEISLGKLDGNLDLNMDGGLLKAEYVGTLKAKLSSSELNITKVKTASISAHGSKIVILTAEDIDIGQLQLDNLKLIGHHNLLEDRQGIMIRSGHHTSTENKYSSLSKYTVKELNSLNVYSSINDKFSIDQLSELKLMEVAFSDFHISKLLKSASGRFDYGELKIFRLGKDSFEKMELSSSYGSILVFGQDTENLKVIIYNITKKDGLYRPGFEYYAKESLEVSSTYKMTSIDDDRKLVYLKGVEQESKNQKGLILITCDHCDLVLN